MRTNGKFYRLPTFYCSDMEQRWRERQRLVSASDGTRRGDLELAAYDAKVHKALREMQLHMSQQLCHLGVPFFGLDPRLVVDHQDRVDGSHISTVKLAELQRKMLDYLESMYGP